MTGHELRIGDVSRMLHLSDQMIRYYEKKGVIAPERSREGNYRIYTMTDIFFLFDAMRYKQWGITISDIDATIHGDYYQKLPEKLRAFETKLRAKIEEETLLAARIGELAHKLKLCRYNVGKFFVFEQPAYTLYLSGRSHGDAYGTSELPDAMAAQIFDENNISFFDVWVEFHPEEMLWWYAIEDRYQKQLALSEQGEKKKTPVQLCLSTFVEMGEMGQFSDALIEPAYNHMCQNGYTLDGVPRGIIIGRGNTQEGDFSRIMELQIPIRI